MSTTNGSTDGYALECFFKNTRMEPLKEPLEKERIECWLEEESGLPDYRLKEIVKKEYGPNTIRLTFKYCVSCFKALYEIRRTIDRYRRNKGLTRLSFFIDVKIVDWMLSECVFVPLGFERMQPMVDVEFDKLFRIKLRQQGRILKIDWAGYPDDKYKLPLARVFILMETSMCGNSELIVKGIEFRRVHIDKEVYRRGIDFIRDLFSTQPEEPSTPSDLPGPQPRAPGGRKRQRQESWPSPGGEGGYVKLNIIPEEDKV